MKCLICYLTTDIKNNLTTLHNTIINGVDKEDCYNKVINNPYWNRLDEDQIINVIPRGSRVSEGYDEYDTCRIYYMQVIYKDGVK